MIVIPYWAVTFGFEATEKVQPASACSSEGQSNAAVSSRELINFFIFVSFTGLGDFSSRSAGGLVRRAAYPGNEFTLVIVVQAAKVIDQPLAPDFDSDVVNEFRAVANRGSDSV